MAGKIVIRILMPDGSTKRVNIESSASFKDLYEIARETLNVLDYGFGLFTDRGCSDELPSSRSVTLAQKKLEHGVMIYYKQLAGSSSQPEPLSSSGSTSMTTVLAPRPAAVTKEDLVDEELSKMDGLITRNKDEKLCRHVNNSRCVHCAALEPYDENYLKEQKIKHLSFHSYLRKQTSGMSRGKFVALEDMNCKIKANCQNHPPWPRGICSKCQPSAITLNRQTYRHVDNVMFENSGIVDEFLKYWRLTGNQRIGFLYGNYEVTTDVPLGIRAVVVAIYEPPQQSTKNGIKLLEDPQDGEVQEMAEKLGLRKVGWIFTDLLHHETESGKVKHLRGGETFFLTAKECLLAGYFQNLHPNPCSKSSTGFFGSKFVTICVTGDKENQIHMEGYQVSAQCMALVRDNCLFPTKDAPELGYVRESTDKQYVPDVFYKAQDQYGNEVQKLARPLPVEYLLVDVPASSPRVPIYTFPANKNPFPVEHRLIDGHLQDLGALHKYMQKFSPEIFLMVMTDFHLLVYLYGLEVFGIRMKMEMTPLLDGVRLKDRNLVAQFMNSNTWSTLEHTIGDHSGHEHGNDQQTSAAGNGSSWQCNHCTFINGDGTQTCEMCQLPR